MTFYVVLELLLRIYIYIYIYFVGVLYKYDEKDQPSLILPTPKSKSAESIIQKDILYPIYHREEQSKISHRFSNFLLCGHMNLSLNLNSNGIELASILLS